MENLSNADSRRAKNIVQFRNANIALNGKTPAQAAGLKPKGWKALLEFATKQA